MSEFERWLRDVIKEIQDNIKALFVLINGEGDVKGIKTKQALLEVTVKKHDKIYNRIEGVVWKFALIGFLVVVGIVTSNKLDDSHEKSLIKGAVKQALKDVGRGGP